MNTTTALNTKVPAGVSGKARADFLTLTDEQKVAYRYLFGVAGQPAGVCYVRVTRDGFTMAAAR